MAPLGAVSHRLKLGDILHFLGFKVFGNSENAQTFVANQLMELSYKWYGYLIFQQLLKSKDINRNVEVCKEKGQIQSVPKEKDYV